MSAYKIIYAIPVVYEHKREDDSTEHILRFKQETIIIQEKTPKDTLLIKEIKRTKMIPRDIVEELPSLGTLLCNGNTTLLNYEIPVINIRSITSQVWRGQVKL
tara:strand:- start:164 stop:472 length:309 start_codon:yes stop_codon:yes gene_type:complete